jgi:hypothetical protein
MKKLIRHIIKEETDQVENKKLSGKDRLKIIADNFGFEYAVRAVGGMDAYVRIVFDGDLKKFYQENGMEPYTITSQPNLYIDDLIVKMLDLPDTAYSKKEKDLGKFSWVSGGIRYQFNARLYLNEYASGKIMWRVVGQSGDSGFGYGWISTRNTLGKRARMQIFKQIIDKYKLDSYK